MTMNAIAIAIGAPALPPFTPNQLPGLVAWYRKNMGITQVANAISRWADASGNANDLIQNTGAAKPQLQGDGTILFDGLAQFLQTGAFTLNQPCTLYLLGRQVTWVNNSEVVDGLSAATNFFQGGGTPQVFVNAGAGAVASNNGWTLNTYMPVAWEFNGASSLIQVNNNVATTGNAGVNNMGGITLGAARTGAAFSNIQVKEMIAYAAAHDAATRTRVIAYLNTL